MSTLLRHGDPPPFRVEHASGASPYVLICDHAGRVFPKALGDLGVSEAERSRHIAWDIGIAGVARLLANDLDAFLITQTYSRLVIDANRHPGSPQSIVTLSERTPIPGNVGLSRVDADKRTSEIFLPYHNRIVEELDARKNMQHESIVVTLHSFTPSFKDQSRKWHAGVLYNRDTRFGHLLLRLMRDEPDLVVGDNEPYAASDETDYALCVHGERRGLLNVEIEIRQDLIETATGQAAWAIRLSRLLTTAYRELRVL